MSHIPLDHNTTVVLCVYLAATHTRASADIESWKKKTKEIPAPAVFLDQRSRHHEI